MTTQDELLERITLNPDVLRGKPIIRGMRIAVEHVLGFLADGMSPAEIVEAYPLLEPADVQACLVYAHKSIMREEVFPLGHSPQAVKQPVG